MAKYKLKFQKLSEIAEKLNISAAIQKIIDYSMYPIVIFDKKGEMVFVNEPLKKLLEDMPLLPYNLFYELAIPALDIKAEIQQVLKGETIKKQDLRISLKEIHPDNPDITFIINLTIFPLENTQNEIAYFFVQIENLTPIRTTEEKLSESAEMYEHLFENVMMGIGITNQEGKVLQVNSALAKMCNYSKQDLLNINIVELYADKKDRTQIVADLLQNGEVNNREVQFQRKDGSLFWMMLNAKKMTYQNTDVFFVACLDITERKRIEQEIERAENRFQKVVDQLPFPMFIVKGMNEIIYYNPKAVEILGPVITTKNSLDELIAQTAVDMEIMENIREIAVKDFIKSKYQKTPRRFLNIKTQTNEIRQIILQIVRIEEDKFLVLGEDVTERAEIENLYETLAEISNDLIWNADYNGKITYVNASVKKMGGYAMKDLKGKKLIDFVHPEDVSLLNIEALTIPSKPITDLEFRFRTKKGEYRHILTSISPILGAQKEVVSVLGISRDITEKKKGQEALQESEQKYRALFENSTMAVSITDFTGTCLEMNVAMAKLIGLPSPDQKGFDFTRLVVNDNDFKEMYRILSTKERMDNYELLAKTTQGKEYWALVSSKVIPYAGKEAVITTQVDITERKMAEKKLREQELQVQVSNTISMIASMFIHDTVKVDENVNNALRTLGNTMRLSFIALCRHDNLDNETTTSLANEWTDKEIYINEDRLGMILQQIYLNQFKNSLPVNIYYKFSTDNPPADISRKVIKNVRENLVGSVLFIPIFSGTHRYGTLVLNDINAYRDFSQKEIQLAMNIAILIGFALKNQTSQESMVEIIDALAELNFAMFIIQNNEKNEPRFVYMNDALCRIMGKKRDELLHLNPFDLAVDEVRDAANFLYRSRQKGGKHPNTYIFTLKTAKGNKKVQMTTNIIEYHQRIATFAILNENIQPGVQPISELVSNHENPSEKATLDE